MMNCFNCNVRSHGFEFKEEESNFAKSKNKSTNLELINEVKNELKTKGEIAKDYGLASSTLSTIWKKEKKIVILESLEEFVEKSAWL